MVATRNTPDPSSKDVIIIGAGASGLLCAAECGKRGRSVLVIDHAERMGAKILISGGGRCNFTNLHADAEHYLSHNPHFCRSALARFTPFDMLALVREAGIEYYEKEAGQLFCVKSSRRILDLLRHECARSGVETVLSCRIAEIQKTDAFTVVTDQGVFRSASLVIATGGLSYPNLGASGFGHQVARRFGLRVTELKPALVPLVFSVRDQKSFSVLAGISFFAAVACGGRSFQGGIVFTHRGISGPAILEASSFWKPGTSLVIDLLPGIDVLAAFNQSRHGRMELHTMLSQFFPKRFAQTWCDLFATSRPIAGHSDRELRRIAERLHAWELMPAATEGYKTAEVTAGGVDTRELSSKTMEAKRVAGLYFIGEVLDVTGRLGGYNLHWAWASGHAAGQVA
jgi:predicted Rossmann fold flavoprotein